MKTLVSYKDRLGSFIEDLNLLISDGLMFPDWKNNGSGEFFIKDSIKDGNGELILGYRQAGDTEALLVHIASVGNMVADDSFYANAYFRFMRHIFFSTDFDGAISVSGRAVPVSLFSLKTLAEGGLKKALDYNTKNK